MAIEVGDVTLIFDYYIFQLAELTLLGVAAQ